MNTLSKVVLFGLYALASAQLRADSEFNFLSGGKRYEIRITASQLAASPLWNPEKEDQPPLPAAKALAKAKRFIGKIETNPGTTWHFEDLSLITVGKVNLTDTVWAWRARWGLRRKGELTTGIWPNMECYILMDGTVLEPRMITPERK